MPFDLRLLHARAGAEPAAPLLDHDAALLVHFARVQRDAAGKVAQRVEAAPHGTRAVGRHVQHVDGFVVARVGIDVRAEPRADRLQVLHQLARLELGAAVEGHVLEHVRQAALVVGLVVGAGPHRQTQQDAVAGPRVVADEIDEAVGQASGGDGRVERQRRREILRRSGGARLAATTRRADQRPASLQYADAMQLRLRRLDPTVPLPAYATAGAAGFDLAASRDVTVAPGQMALVPTGLVVEVPPEYFLAIFARSSTPLKRGLMVANGVGVVDSDYAGPEDEVRIPVLNVTRDEERRGARGDRIAQGIILPAPRVEWREVDAELRQESRGGFGATGR